MFSWDNFVQQAQERRLVQLSSDNAFVDVKSVLSSSSAAASVAAAKGGENALSGGTNKVSHRNRGEETRNIERRFFEVGPTGASGSLRNTMADTASGALRVDRLRGGDFGANERLNLTQCFAQQHKDYMEMLTRAWKDASESEGVSADEACEDDDSRSREEAHNLKVGESFEGEVKTVGLRQAKRTRASKKGYGKKRQQASVHDTTTKGQPQRRYLKQGEVRWWCPTKVEDVETELSDEIQLLRAWYSEMARVEDSDHESEEGHDTTGDNANISPQRDCQQAKKPKIHGTGLKDDKAHKVKVEYEQPNLLAPSVLRFLTSCPSYIAMTSPSPLSLSSPQTKGRVKVAPGCHTHHLCSVCLLPAAYRCVRCRSALFCSIKCHVAHDATRCLKYTV